MNIRNFLVALKVVSKLNIKKQWEVFIENKTIKMASFTERINRCNCLTPKQKKETNSLYEQQNEFIKINKEFGGILTIVDSKFPKQLREIYCPPTVLFYKGDISILDTYLASIVGARDCSSYGRRVLLALVPQITPYLTIVSGLAKGVDCMAHEYAINNGGKTIAVIGTGLNRVYPKSNSKLQGVIAKKHLLITEYPLGAKPLRHHFVERNRIIAGISASTTVVEARKQSGSLITANFALSENRNVLAVPGEIFSETSRGTNDLIQAGARPLTSLEDILEESII